MVIEEAYQCSEALTAAQVATVTAALQKGWKPTSSGTALTGTSVELPNRTETVTGTITVAADGSYKFFGTMPSSLLPSSGGVAMPSTLTVSGPEGIAIANDGTITMGGAGSIQISTSTRPVTVMMKVEDIPSTQSVLAGVTLNNSKGMTFTRTATGFQNGEASGTSIGTNSGNAWGAASTTTVSDGEHWLTLTYEHTSNGTHSYMDGSSVACSTDNNGLRYSGLDVTTVSIGGSTFIPLSNYTSAKGMVIKDVQIYSSRLTAAQVKTATAALNKGWAPTVAAGTTFGGANVELPDGTAHVTGQIVIATDGTYTFSGGLSVLSGTVTVPTGTAITSVSTGATVLVPGGSPATLEAAIAGGYALSATLNIANAANITSTIKLVDSNGNDAVNGSMSSYESGVATFTGTAPANPTYSGSAWWWDYEFNEDSGVDYTSGNTTYRKSMPNTGNADTAFMSLESLNNTMYTAADANGNREIYFQQTPWRNASFNSLTEMTAVMYCQPGNYANTVLVGFGSTTASGTTAIALVTGDNPSSGDMKLVLVTGTSQTVTTLATLKAVDATTKKHLYAFVMDRITEDETAKTRVRVYLDGKVKAIYKHSGTLALSDGFQIGSLHGGVLNSGLSKYSSSGDSGTLDFLRVFNGSLSDSAMAALADAYKYESAHGSATRDAVSAAASWVATDVWTQTVPEETDAVQDAPNADTNVTLSKGGSSDVVAVALNLESDSNYESLTLTKEAGATGTLKITSAYGNTTSGKLVAAATSILVDTVIPAGRANLGITSIGDGVTLTVDPFSGTGNYAILSELEQLGPGGVFEDIVISMAILGEGASVVLDSTGASALAQYGFTAALTYNESNQSYTFRVTRSAAVDVDVTISQSGTTWKANDVGMPVQTEMPSTYTGTVTIYNISGSPATVDTTFAGGNLVVAASKTVNDNSVNTSSVTLTGAIATSGTVTFNGAVDLGGTGQTVSSAVTGSGVVTVSGSVNLTGSIANTVAGNGTIALSALSQTLTFGAWTGTVALPAFTGDAITLNSYGIAGSTVRVSGSAGWLRQDHANVIPGIELGGDWTLPYFSASFDNTLAKLSGAYKFTLGASTISYDAASQTPYFLIKDVSAFTGSLETSAAGIVLGAASKPTGRDHGGKILVYGNVTVGEGATWTAPNGVVLMEDSATLTVPSGATVLKVATSVDNSYAKADAGESSTVYSVDEYNTVTFDGANMTATRTDELESAIKDGDAITFTVASAEGYVVTGVAATPEGGSPETLIADNGVYSYVVNGNVTITVSVVAVAEPSFDVYYAGYGQAKTVTVAALEGSVYTLQVGSGEAVTGVYENGKVTFADVTGFTPGTAVNYTITVSGAAAGTKSGTVTAAAPTVSGWVSETKTTIGTASATGTWSPDAPTFGDAGSAALSGETTFIANSQASGKVTLTTVVNFGNEAAPTIEIGADAKAAIKVENNSFKIWTKTTSEGGTGATADWLTVSGATPTLAADSTVVFTFDTDAKTFTVSVDGAALYYGESDANTSFAFASDGVAISSVAYKGAGSFTSLTGAYATTDVTTSVDGKQVVVANSFISGNAALCAMTVAEAAAALAPDATPESNPAAFADGGNGINYFKCYALGLDPKKTDDKPIVDVTVEDGKYVFTVKHPIFDSEGEITGYEVITPADNVSTTVTLKYGTDADSIATVESGAATGISPADMFNQAGLNGSNVIYYKAEVTISAK